MISNIEEFIMNERDRLTPNQSIFIKHILSFEKNRDYLKELGDTRNITKEEFHIIVKLLRSDSIRGDFPSVRDYINSTIKNRS